MSNQRKFKGEWTQEMSDMMFNEYNSHIWIPNPVVGDIWLDQGRFKYKIVKVVNAPPNYQYPKQFVDMEFLGESQDNQKIRTYKNDPSNYPRTYMKNITGTNKTDTQLLNDWNSYEYDELEQRISVRFKEEQARDEDYFERQEYERLKKKFENNNNGEQ